VGLSHSTLKAKNVSLESREAAAYGSKLSSGGRIKKVYAEKAVLFGDRIDRYQYDRVRVTFAREEGSPTRKTEGERQESSIKRSATQIYRLVEANVRKHGDFEPVFATLTFKENIEDLKLANNIFKNFLKRLNYKLDTSLRYICVPEIQYERQQKYGVAVWHFHVVFFNLPFLPFWEFQETWGQGWTRIEGIDEIRSMGAYLAKYLQKSLMERKLFGRKAYFTSRALCRPIEVWGITEVRELLSGVIILAEETKNYKEVKITRIVCRKLSNISDVLMEPAQREKRMTSQKSAMVYPLLP